MWARVVLVAAVSFLLVQGAAALVLRPLDLDGDGLSTSRESELGTDARRADTDGDSLGDGWEVERGLRPLSRDSDDDGLLDLYELQIGSDPKDADSDADGLSDSAEDPRFLADSDCDDDGIASILESDDDADQRPDAAEDAAARCQPDVDGDGILDGLEGAVTCVSAVDCDRDGVNDGDEGPAGFDPLDPDSFSVHLPDSVSFAFAKAGQPPGTDADGDGIPDPWESQGGLIQWGPYAPRANQRDLLIEFVRVLGPGSGTFSSLQYGPVYELVKSTFVANGLQFQYVETILTLPVEPAPPLIPTRNAPYYRDILSRSAHATNPYVTTVVINPQHDQTDIVHSGVAPIRGMLAAVDASQFVKVAFRSASGNVSLDAFPVFYESLIRDRRLTSPANGVHPDGKLYMMLTDSQGGLHEFQWRPAWFGQPRIQVSSGAWVDLVRGQTTVLERDFAHTVLHELGHTLGLCHTHDADCRQLLPLDQQARQRESSMSYQSTPGTLAFLPGEWERARAYLVCPPPTPIRLIAEGASQDALLDAKYAYTLDQILNVGLRSCQDLAPVAHDLDAVPEANVHSAPPELAPPEFVTNTGRATATYWAASVVVGAGAAGAVGRWQRRRIVPPSGWMEFPKE